MLDKHLFLTRLESQNKDMYYENIYLKRLVIDEIQITRYISQAKGIDFELEFDDNYKVYTDTKWCRMMIRQILSNAVKYSENSTIHVSGKLLENHVTLEIDEGRGISKKICREFLIKVLLQRKIVMKRHLLNWLIFGENVKEKLG